MHEQYHFKQESGDIIIATDKNSLINYVNAKGGLAILPTVRNRVVYRSACVAANVRSHLGWLQTAKQLSLR